MRCWKVPKYFCSAGIQKEQDYEVKVLGNVLFTNFLACWYWFHFWALSKDEINRSACSGCNGSLQSCWVCVTNMPIFNVCRFSCRKCLLSPFLSYQGDFFRFDCYENLSIWSSKFHQQQHPWSLSLLVTIIFIKDDFFSLNLMTVCFSSPHVYRYKETATLRVPLLHSKSMFTKHRRNGDFNKLSLVVFSQYIFLIYFATLSFSHSSRLFAPQQ